MDFEAGEFLKTKQPFIPEVGVICGSGLAGLADVLTDVYAFDYSAIPGFPKTSVQGHKGKLIYGYAGENKVKVALLQGRFHSYEGHDIKLTAYPGRLFKDIGCKVMLVTNAAGGINKNFKVADIMLITDHIGFPLLAGKHPLVGPNEDSIGPRFPSMSDAYDVGLRNLMKVSAMQLKMEDFFHPKGCYCMLSGPTYETAAESNMLRILEVDAVGMSTVPEVVFAKHAGLRVIGLSMITNKVVLPGDAHAPASHAEVLQSTKLREKDVQELVLKFLNNLPQEPKILTDYAKLLDETNLFQPTADRILKEIKDFDVSNATPLQALCRISDWQRKLK